VKTAKIKVIVLNRQQFFDFSILWGTLRLCRHLFHAKAQSCKARKI